MPGANVKVDSRFSGIVHWLQKHGCPEALKFVSVWKSKGTTGENDTGKKFWSLLLLKDTSLKPSFVFLSW